MEEPMLTEEQLAVLRDIDNSVAFDDAAKADQLVLEGYAEKDGDIYQLTSKGEKSLLDNGALDPGV
jgi:hypothetical protein